MELTKEVKPEEISYIGKGNFRVLNRDRLKVKNGSEFVLNEKPPSGKDWIVTLNISIVETGD